MNKSKIRIFVRWGRQRYTTIPGIWYNIDPKSLSTIKGDFIKIILC